MAVAMSTATDEVWLYFKNSINSTTITTTTTTVSGLKDSVQYLKPAFFALNLGYVERSLKKHTE